MSKINQQTGQEEFEGSTIKGDLILSQAQQLGLNEAPLGPLAFRMFEHSPVGSVAFGFSGFKGANTLLRGGYFDDISDMGSKGRIKSKLVARRAKRYNIFQNDVMSGVPQSRFFGTKPGLLRAKLQNMNYLDPRNMFRYSSATAFGEGLQGGMKPFSGLTGSLLSKSKKVQKAFENAGVKDVREERNVFSGGLNSIITAGRKLDKLERKAATGNARALTKLQTADRSMYNVLKMNNPEMFNQRMFFPLSIGSQYDDAARYFVGVSNAGRIGARGNLAASTAWGSYTQYFAGYARGAQGFARAGALSGNAAKGAQAAEKAFAQAFETAASKGGKIASMGVGSTAREGAEYLAKSGGKVMFRELGLAGVREMAASGGAKVLAARAASLAIPGLNVVAAVSFAYDIGKMAGEAIKSTIELGKDAVKSMKGTIYKPSFGMGYKDTEAAATSRSRGVMAIQNSQLNARSALGGEAAMMAAHYG